MSRVIAIVLVLVLLSGLARAEPARVVLADPDPELERAVEASLAPWKLSVVVAPTAPHTPAEVEGMAAESHARFVVWRDGDRLLVFDRELATTTERPAQAGAFDPVTAASAALTVKTMMRLPPLSPDATVVDRPAGACNELGGIDGAGCHGGGSPIIGLAVAGALRIAHGSETDVGARVLLAMWVQPSAVLGLRLALVGDVGSSTRINHAGFKGTANDWALLASVAWVLRAGSWELEPALAAGVERTSMSGSEMSTTQRDESETLATLRGSLAVRRRLGRWTAGALVGVDTVLGTPTYSRSMGTTIFEVPGFAVVTGIVLGADLGR